MLREAEWKLHEECLEAGREALRKWRAAGKAASLGEVVKLLEFGARLARLAAGMPDNHTMITGEDGEPIRIQFEAALAQAYGPVVDVVSEVVEGEPERMANGKRDRETGEVRSQVTAVEGGAGGGAEVRGTDRGAVRCVEAAGSVDGENHSGQAHEGAPA
jgi:hypothetical protein